MATKLTAADLRLGNLVLCGGKICKVVLLEEDGIKVKWKIGKAYAHRYASVYPIQLTKEMALILEFKPRKEDDWMILCINDYTFYFNHSTKVLQVEYLGDVAYYSLRNNHVHTLQNLVKYLTNTELTIKEDKQ